MGTCRAVDFFRCWPRRLGRREICGWLRKQRRQGRDAESRSFPPSGLQTCSGASYKPLSRALSIGVSCGMFGAGRRWRYALLTRSDFGSAVRDALRHYARTDLLAGNALLHTQLLARSGSGAATPNALKALIAEAAETLFANQRDQTAVSRPRSDLFQSIGETRSCRRAAGPIIQHLSSAPYRRCRPVDRVVVAARARGSGNGGYCWKQPDSAADAVEEGSPADRPRLSIVILPFLNLSQEANADYLVDGIVDALITDLSSCLPGSFVISRSTAFTYKGRSVPIRQVGTELGVRYVLEGSVLGRSKSPPRQRPADRCGDG